MVIIDSNYLFGLLGHIDAWTVIWQKRFGIYMIGTLGRSY